MRSLADQRAREICARQLLSLRKRTDRLFAWLMLFQWVGGIGAAMLLAPRAWAGSASTVHPHLLIAVVFGALITIPAALLGFLRSGQRFTRHTIAVCQVLTSALLIHLTGGRIETHFHVFGSLAFLAFYRDWKVLVTATIVVAADHLLRGLFWPQSVYGILSVSPWRWMEHTGWVLFEDAFLIHACIRGVREIRTLAEHQAHLEATNREVAAQVRDQTQKLQENQLQLFHAAKLELVGRLAAGVAHEVKNPLAVTLLGVNYLESANLTKSPEARAVVGDMKEAICRADTVIRGLLDFAASRPIDMRPQSIHTVVDQALLLVRGDLLHAHVEIQRDYDESLPLVRLDAQKVQQVLVNVFVNACHAMPAGGQLAIRTRWADNTQDAGRSSGRLPAGKSWVHVQVDDTGTGIPEEVLERVFDPFFTTKPAGQGTGLGLSVSRRIMALHQASIGLANRDGGGARATLVFPALEPEPTPCSRAGSSSSTTK